MSNVGVFAMYDIKQARGMAVYKSLLFKVEWLDLPAAGFARSMEQGSRITPDSREDSVKVEDSAPVSTG